MTYPFGPTMLSGPGAGPEGWRRDGFPQVAAGVRAPVPGRGRLRRMVARAPLGIGLRLPGVRPRRVLAARAQGPDPAVPACRRETSVTAGTVMHRRHLPLKVWFTAAWLGATHRNGMSARQLWLQLGLGSYESAWLLLRKLRAALVDPDREPLAGLVEVDV